MIVVETQTTLLDAAMRAGASRFIPSDQASTCPPTPVGSQASYRDASIVIRRYEPPLAPQCGKTLGLNRRTRGGAPVHSRMSEWGPQVTTLRQWGL